MEAYKMNKTHLSSLYGVTATQFLDLDTCCVCGGHNGPFIWLLQSRRRTGTKTYFVCEECYKKIKEAG